MMRRSDWVKSPPFPEEIMRHLYLTGLLCLAIGCDDKDGSEQPADTGDAVITDSDGDGIDAEAYGGTDCNDADAATYPGADELCDGIDNNCDGEVDEGAFSTFHEDSDGDGFGDADATVEACEVPAGYVDDDTDCDDRNASRYPGADELCNGLDDNCNDEIDEDPIDEGDWYIDNDGDGYGDPSSYETGCIQPGNTASQGEDCDDTDPSVNPGEAELCDGRDNDCDASTSEDGQVIFTDDSGSYEDVTAIFASGTPDYPALYVASRSGELSFCGGSWYGALQVSTDIELDVIGVGGAENNTLDASAVYPLLYVDASADITIEGMTMTGGDASGYAYSNYGGGIYCVDSDAALSFDDVVLTESSATYGGAGYIEGCDMSFTSSIISENTANYGAAFYMKGGAYSFEDSIISDNVAGYYGGAFYIYGYSATKEISLDLIDTMVQDNSAYYYGSALYVYGYSYGTSYDIDISCTGSVGSDAGFYNNTRSYTYYNYGALYLYFYGTGAVRTFTADNCDFGEEGSANDNSPYDIYLTGTNYDYGDDESFTCTADSVTCE